LKKGQRGFAQLNFELFADISIVFLVIIYWDVFYDSNSKTIRKIFCLYRVNKLFVYFRKPCWVMF